MKFQRFTPSGCKVIWIRKFQFVAKIQLFYDIILFFFLSAPVQVWFQFIISFYSFHPSQSKICSSLSYPFILLIRYSSRLVPIYYVILVFLSVLVKDWSQVMISLHSILIFWTVPFLDRSKFVTSVDRIFYPSVPLVPNWAQFIMSLWLINLYQS